MSKTDLQAPHLDGRGRGVRMRRWLVPTLLCGSILAAACGSDTSAERAASGTSTPELLARTETGAADTVTSAGAAGAAATHAAHWSYDGEAGPEHWGELSEEWALCAAGAEQSPIDVDGATTAGSATAPPAGKVGFNYQPSAYEVVDNGHTLQVNLTAGGTLTLDGTPYQLVQFHAHAPSEHTVDSVQYPLEYHLVHKSADGALAVVGVFVQEGAAHQVWDSVLAQMPPSEDKLAGSGTIDATALLPADRTLVRYRGSLTTPPCSESVRWNVMLTPVTLSHAQLALFTARFPNNHRPTQPRNVRDLEVVAG